MQLPSSASAYFARKVAGLIPDALLAAITPLLEQLESLSDAIQQYDEEIERIARTERPETKQLEQVTGVGTLTALAFVLTISDPHRFAKSRQVAIISVYAPSRISREKAVLNWVSPKPAIITSAACSLDRRNISSGGLVLILICGAGD